MDESAEHESAAVAIDAPARERARRLLDVLLRVAAFAERKELHHFTREILVGRSLAVLRTVEVDHHRRIARHRVQQVTEVAERVGAQRDVLAVHQQRELHLLLAGHEMVMPEQGHPLGERRRRSEHLAQPPPTQFEALAHLLLLEELPFHLRCVVAGPRIAKRADLRCPRRRRRERGRTRAVEELAGGLLAAHPDIALDLA